MKIQIQNSDNFIEILDPSLIRGNPQFIEELVETYQIRCDYCSKPIIGHQCLNIVHKPKNELKIVLYFFCPKNECLRNWSSKDFKAKNKE